MRPMVRSSLPDVSGPGDFSHLIELNSFMVPSVKTLMSSSDSLVYILLYGAQNYEAK